MGNGTGFWETIKGNKKLVGEAAGLGALGAVFGVVSVILIACAQAIGSKIGKQAGDNM